MLEELNLTPSLAEKSRLRFEVGHEVDAQKPTNAQNTTGETAAPNQTREQKQSRGAETIRMPAPGGTKRVRGVQIFRPFVYGTEAIPFDPEHRPKDVPPDHTHRWKVFVRGVDGEDISYWLRKVQFKLHDT